MTRLPNSGSFKTAIPNRWDAFIERWYVDDSDQCWNWRGQCGLAGYGTLCWDHNRSRYAHRLAFEWANGREPTGVVHHTCENRRCCNPTHLVEMKRGAHNALHRRDDESCRRGHPRTPANTYFYAPTGQRFCRACRKERARRRSKRQKDMVG